LLVSSTAKLLVTLVVGVEPKATAGSDFKPRSANSDGVTAPDSKPNKRRPSDSPPTVSEMLESSPVVPDLTEKLLLLAS